MKLKNTYNHSITFPSNEAHQPMIGVLFCVKIKLNIYIFLLDYGTGSTPPFENGLHLNILFKAKYVPLKGPYFSIASNAYCEHVGIYLQCMVFFRADKYFR